MRIDFDIIQCRAAIKHYGRAHQAKKAMEELSECIAAIARADDAAENKEQLIEEMADVLVMFRQLQLIYGITDEDLQRLVEYKQMRCRDYIINDLAGL